MKKINLTQIQHNIKIGDLCEYKEANVIEDSIFYNDGEPIGFYLTKLPDKAAKLADLANYELRSNNVPKSMMGRSAGQKDDSKAVEQYSTIK